VPEAALPEQLLPALGLAEEARDARRVDLERRAPLVVSSPPALRLRPARPASSTTATYLAIARLASLWVRQRAGQPGTMDVVMSSRVGDFFAMRSRRDL
jgi:hypothetical protein